MFNYMAMPRFIHSVNDEHFWVFTSMNKAVMNVLIMLVCSHIHSFLQGTYLGAELLGHRKTASLPK